MLLSAAAVEFQIDGNKLLEGFPPCAPLVNGAAGAKSALVLSGGGGGAKRSLLVDVTRVPPTPPLLLLLLPLRPDMAMLKPDGTAAYDDDVSELMVSDEKSVCDVSCALGNTGSESGAVDVVGFDAVCSGVLVLELLCDDTLLRDGDSVRDPIAPNALARGFILLSVSLTVGTGNPAAGLGSGTGTLVAVNPGGSLVGGVIKLSDVELNELFMTLLFGATFSFSSCLAS